MFEQASIRYGPLVIQAMEASLSDDRKPSPLAGLSKPGEAEALMRRSYPRETVDTMHALTGVPVRSITRWMKDEARLPPTLKAKLQVQATGRRAFLDDLRDLLERHESEGLLPETMRQAILVELSGDYFKKSQEL